MPAAHTLSGASALTLRSIPAPGIGELLQVLIAARNNAGISLQKVQVNPSDIRGEIVVTDPASDGDQNAPRSQTILFRTLRVGLESYLDLTRMLSESVGGVGKWECA